MTRILIVEDNPMLAEAIERAGEQLQLFADRATDGWDAIEMLECGEYAAIVEELSGKIWFGSYGGGLNPHGDDGTSQSVICSRARFVAVADSSRLAYCVFAPSK